MNTNLPCWQIPCLFVPYRVVFVETAGPQVLSPRPRFPLQWSACIMSLLIKSLSRQALRFPCSSTLGSACLFNWKGRAAHEMQYKYNVLIKWPASEGGRLRVWEVDHKVRDICPHKHKDRWTPSWGPFNVDEYEDENVADWNVKVYHVLTVLSDSRLFYW